MKSYRIFLLLCFLSPIFLFGQQKKIDFGKNYLIQNQEVLELSKSDLDNLFIKDIYTTKHNGVTHIYYEQNINGIPVYDAILNLNISKDDKMLFSGNTFITDLENKINTAKSVFKASDAIKAVAKRVGVQNPEDANLLKSGAKGSLTFAETSYSTGEIKVKPKYYAVNESDVRLTWEVEFFDVNNLDSWNTRVDAVTGQVLDHKNMTLSCKHEPGAFHNHTAACRKQNLAFTPKAKPTKALTAMSAQYRVYAVPAESPVRGAHELVVDPHFPEASPFGWHDIDGVEGPDYLITRGNNVHAYQDLDNDFVSLGDEPNGGPELLFDFPHDTAAEPETNTDADVVNLFYAINMIHDITYLMGFDERSGNFQVNNYGNGGIGSDPVIAHALDGSGTNNANFSLTTDGTSGNMNMFRWDIPQSRLFSVSEPMELNVNYQNGVTGDGWGVANGYPGIDITAEMAPAYDDDPQFPNNVCGEVANPDEIDGKIAMIYRGRCEFGTKALNAQEAGAVAVVICNVPGAGNDPTSDGNDPISGGMGPGVNGLNVTIPVLALGFSDCNRIVATIEAGTPVVARILPEESGGPAQLSAGFDNGIIFHEFGHGISSRLVGGPSTVCLNSDEQMGEGWSDFFTLALTVEPGDLGTDARGIGNYVEGNDDSGRGIRRFPYSTDMNVNPQTFKDIKATTAPHPLGEIWVNILWDIFWGYVDAYGYDADWTNSQSGNFQAVQLVLDGMKMNPCNPGFINGRDALLAADMANTGGVNQCLIWDRFARRGLGFFADGGSVNNRNDGVENFETLPECVKSVKIYKDIPSLTSKDEPVDVILTVSNNKDEDLENVVVSDFIPEGLSYIDGSANVEPTIMGDQIIFEIENFASGAWDSLTYSLQQDDTEGSSFIFTNAVESNEERNSWQRVLIEDETNIFRLNSNTVYPTYSGEFCWFVQEVDDDTEAQIIYTGIDVTGVLPVVRFWHRINTEFARNGGFVEISTDGVIWEDARSRFIRNGYECPLAFTTFAIPALNAFSGSDSDDFIDSYIDLSDFKGETVLLRFRFGTNSGTGNEVGDETFAEDAGWFIDDLDLIDLFTGQTEACITTSEEQVCTNAALVLFEPDQSLSTIPINIEGVAVNAYPNPANDFITLEVSSDNAFDANVLITSIDGKISHNQRVSINNNLNRININTSHLESGMYLVQLLSSNGLISKKIFIE